MKKFFILLFCLFFFQLQALADNKFQREYENQENFDKVKQYTKNFTDEYNKETLLALLFYRDENRKHDFFDRFMDELEKAENSNKYHKYISCYYLAKIMFYTKAFLNDTQKVFDEEIIVDDREWVLLTPETKHIIAHYNILAKTNNPNPKAVINSSKQKEAEDETTFLKKHFKDYKEESGKEALIRGQFTSSKKYKGNLQELVVQEYKRLNEPGAPKEDISCYYLTIIMLNSVDYTKRGIYPKPIIVDNKDWKYLTPKTEYAIVAHNLILKVYNE